MVDEHVALHIILSASHTGLTMEAYVALLLDVVSCKQ